MVHRLLPQPTFKVSFLGRSETIVEAIQLTLEKLPDRLGIVSSDASMAIRVVHTVPVNNFVEPWA